MGLESIEKGMREMGENMLLDMVLCVHSGWTCFLNMEMGAFLGRPGWGFLFKKVLSHSPCGVATFNYHSVIYNKYICYLCVQQHVKYWDPNIWNDAWHRSKATNTETSVFSSWMEDEFGRDIPDAIRSNLCDNANSYWTDMYTKGKIPKPWGSTGFERKENFWIIMEGKYPWLHLCNGHWKA